MKRPAAELGKKSAAEAKVSSPKAKAKASSAPAASLGESELGTGNGELGKDELGNTSDSVLKKPSGVKKPCGTELDVTPQKRIIAVGARPPLPLAWLSLRTDFFGEPQRKTRT